ncbi:hypothetical protein TNCV_5051191 [Trichonephila clavipes]|nr:hypothetical protein TNCV_5051191 [Trichonephila clavipes]
MSLDTSSRIIGAQFEALIAESNSTTVHEIPDQMHPTPLRTYLKLHNVDKDDVEGEVHLLRADLIREGLKFAGSMEEHFLTHDPDIERALKFRCNHKFCVAGYQELYKQLEEKKPAANNRQLKQQ